MTHIDEWLDSSNRVLDQGELYAAFVLDHMRMPGWKITAYQPYTQQFKLFCTFEGERWRVVGASRMGDVWLSRDFAREAGYEMRVDVDLCSNWGNSPDEQNGSNDKQQASNTGT